MSAIMVVHMKVETLDWMPTYFAEVSKILADYGAVSVAGGLEIVSLEGSMPPPSRVAVLSFPDLESIQRFMSDERYLPYLQARREGSKSEIFIFENMVVGGELV